MKMTKLVLAGSMVGMLSSGAALAATVDGDLGINGVSSTGTVDITLTVPDLVRVSNLNAITMTDNGTSFSGSDPVCVYRNFTGNYTVTADGTQVPGTFTLQDGTNASSVLYTVDWGGNALTATTAVALGGADQTSQSCGGGTNLTLTVDATYEAVSAATIAGAHTDVLNLTVAPN